MKGFKVHVFASGNATLIHNAVVKAETFKIATTPGHKPVPAWVFYDNSDKVIAAYPIKYTIITEVLI